MRLTTLFAAGAAVLASFAFAAPASAATPTTTLNVRDAPGGNVVDVIRPGDQVTIVRRSGGWCELDKPGVDGWSACRYLTEDDDDDIVIPDDDEPASRPDVSVTFSVPGFSFSIGDGGFDIGPSRPGRGDRICFYEHVNYDGRSFCMEPGDRRTSLGAWNDRISSIRVFGDVEAQVCENNNYRGRCVIIDRNVRNLGSRGNDIISSIRVRSTDFTPPPARDDRVCFYEDFNYGGRSFCMEPGDRRNSLGPWNDRISSIRVFGDAEAQVCEHNNFNGRCAVVDSNQRRLAPRNNDIISSIRVR